MRVEFLVKMRLNQRRRRDPRPLIEAQQQILARPFGQLTDGIDGDVVDLWRHHNANAAQTFLEHLAAHHPPG
jgi:hypothetical protein